MVRIAAFSLLVLACGSAPPGASCPNSCQSLGLDCGQADDGCNGLLDCGGCAAGQSCGGGGPNRCGTGICTPKTCASLGYQCGRASDGCAALLDCGTCATGFCGGAGAHHCGACQPATCASLGKNCGTVDDGCGNPLDCGATCPAGQTCGGAGVTNLCGNGCVATTCDTLKKDCGMVDDGCGSMLSCGACSGYLTCGGAGTANVCGASCASSCPNGFSCDDTGVCDGGDVGSLVLNEVGYAVSGAVTVGGAAPNKSAAYCSNASNLTDNLINVSFTDSTRGYSATYAINCNAPDFSFSLVLPPGSYGVRVSPGTYGAAAGVNVLPLSYLARSALAVSGPVANLALDEIGYPVSGTLTVNGAAPTKSAVYCNNASNLNDNIANVSFNDSVQGYSATYAIRCNAPDFSFSLTLPPGSYDVHVNPGTYATAAGVNLLGVSYLAKSALTVSGPLSGLALDELGYPVSGTVTVGGAAPNKSAAYCSNASNLTDNLVNVGFTDSLRGYSATYAINCNAPDFSFNLLLPPGSYDVRVSPGTYGAAAGVNVLPLSYLARSALAVSGPVANLALDEIGYPVSGTLTVNGAPPTKSAVYCNNASNLNDNIANVSFNDSVQGYSATYAIRCNAPDFSFSLTLPPGSYDVHVNPGTYATAAGVNLLGVSYLAKSALTVSGPLSGLALDELGYPVSGTVTVGGAAPNKSAAYCSNASNLTDNLVNVGFTDSLRGYSATYAINCNAPDFSFNLLLPPGSYGVRVSPGTYSAAAGVNVLPLSYLARSALAVSGPVANLALDEIGYPVSGTLTVNGAPPTKSAVYCNNASNLNDNIANVSFNDSVQGYSATYAIKCNAPDFSFSLVLPMGIYGVHVAPGTYATAAGVNLLGVSYEAVTRLAVP